MGEAEDASSNFLVDQEKFEDYVEVEPSAEVRRNFPSNPFEDDETLIFARLKSEEEAEKPSAVIRKAPKKDGKASAFFTAEKYLREFVAVKSTNFILAGSFFEDDGFTYTVYPFYELIRIDDRPDDQRRSIAIQYLSILRSLHRDGIVFLKSNPSSFFVNERGKLLIFGFDTAVVLPDSPAAAEVAKKAQKKGSAPTAPESPSALRTVDPKTPPEVDWLSAGALLFHLYSRGERAYAAGESVFESSRLDSVTSSDRKGLIAKLLNASEVVKDNYDPRSEEWLRQPIKVDKSGNRFAINDFHIDWSDGFLAGYGNTEIGFSARREEVFVKSDDCLLTLGSRGLTLSNPHDWWVPAVTIDENGVTVRQGWFNWKFGPDGLKGHFNWGSDFELSEEGVRLNQSGQISFLDGKLTTNMPNSAIKKRLKKLNLVVKVRETTELSLGKDGFHVAAGRQKFQLNASGLKMKVREASFAVVLGSKFKVQMKINTGKVKVSADGVDIVVGDAVFHADTSVIRFAVEGFTLIMDDQGTRLESDNPEIDIPSVLPPIPKPNFTVPKLQLPKLPPLPKVPSVDLSDIDLGDGLIPKIGGLPDVPSLPSLGGITSKLGLPKLGGLGGFRNSMSVPNLPKVGGLLKGKKEPEGKIEDHLQDGETVVDQVDIQRRRKLISKKTVHLVRTSNNRLFFVSALYGQKRGGDVVLGKSSTVTPVKSSMLKIVLADGHDLTVTFKNASDRDPWKGKIEEMIQALG